MLLEPFLPAAASRKPLGWIAIAGTLASLAASFSQLHQTPGTAFYGMVSVDAFSIYFHLLIAMVLLATLLSSLEYFEEHTTHAGEYFALLAFACSGMMLMTSAADLLLVFIGLEISSISTYILAGFRKTEGTSAEAALKYFLLGSFATAFFLYGIALLFGATGSSNIAGISAGLATGPTPVLAILALAMILIGLGFKVSAAPFHVWTPDVYQGAPAPVVGLMSTAPKAAAFAVLLRITYGALPTLGHGWTQLIAILAAASMTIGNLGALQQRNVKRMLAYSSIAHAGYLLVAFTALSQEGIAAASFYAAAYAAMNIGAFTLITHFAGYKEELQTIDDYTGLARRSPVLAAVFGLFLLSLIGIPFTGGFFGKFYVFTAALHSGLVWLAIVGLLNSGLGCFYYLRLLVRLYSAPDRVEEMRPTPKLTVPLAIAVALAAIATLVLGIVPGHVLHLAQAAAATYSSIAK
jgi:NADH-quinone oxidoreductase subunit N